MLDETIHEKLPGESGQTMNAFFRERPKLLDTTQCINVYISNIIWKLAYFYVLLYQKRCFWPHKKHDWPQPRLSTESHRGGNQTNPALKLSTYPAMTVARPRRKNHRRLDAGKTEECHGNTQNETTIDNKSWECRKKKVGRFPWEDVKSKNLAFFVEAYLIVGSLTKIHPHIHTGSHGCWQSLIQSSFLFGN